MLRTLGLHHALRWFLVACVVLAIWEGFHGNLYAMIHTVMHWVQQGADVITSLWSSAQKKH